MARQFKILAIIIILISLLAINASAQLSEEIAGDWYGTLKTPTFQLPIVFHFIKDADGKHTATMDSPEQAAYGIKITSVAFMPPDLVLMVAAVKGKYQGKLNEKGEIIGSWQQGALKAPLNLTRKKPVGKKRPQTPAKPYPYKEIPVTFKSESAGHTLSGTLTLPSGKGPFPAVILISGSGPQDRDESLLGHKPFLILSDHLTRKGLAVLRYDDRGTAKSGGDFSTVTSIDLADDAETAFEFLQTRSDIDKKKTGFAGHSEGGLLAPMIAARNRDVAFICLLAGPGIDGKQILLLQTNLISKAAGASDKILDMNSKVLNAVFNLVLSEPDNQKVRDSLASTIKTTIPEEPEFLRNQITTRISGGQLNELLTPWFRFFLEYDPYPTLTKVKCPVLAINGELDLQVPPGENLAAIKKALLEGGNKNYKIVELARLNHLFQTATTGSPTEYGKIEETFSPKALELISSWILQTVK